MGKRLIVAGNIGVGKSSLVELLSARLGFDPYFEPVAENPYISDFYSDMGRWAFHSQLFFLSHRLKSQVALMRESSSIIQDRSIYEDAEIFAKNLYLQGSIGEREWKVYSDLYRSMIDMIPPPDLVVYLKASTRTLMGRIAKRGRDFESEIPEDYLARLNSLYEEWIEGFSLAPVLIVPADRLDFVAERNDLEAIARIIVERLRDRQGLLFPYGM
jgi:deoxyadenosine/deoxycytidine kinase